jgi:hypothetical protein
MRGGPNDEPGAPRPRRQALRIRPRRHPHPPSTLPTGLRVFLISAGWLMILIGLAGLVLPGIQGVLTLVAGAALLSVASENAYWVLRRLFRRWPRGWRRVERARRWIYRRVALAGGIPGMRRADEVLSRWEQRLVARVQASWRLLPLHLLGSMLLIAVVVEPLYFERWQLASKLPLAAALALAMVRRRGRARWAARDSTES